MNKRFPKAKWVLPAVIDPPERLCFTIQVPNERQHIAAFRGALLNLASAIAWQDDPDHTAKDVALVWRSIVDEVDNCLMAVTDVRQNEESPCILEKQIDGGGYVEFADLQKCPPILRRNGSLIQGSTDGGLTFFTFPEANETIEGTDEPAWPDPPPGETGNCLAAENITAMLAQEVSEWINTLNAGALALGIITVVMGALAIVITLGTATPAIVGIATVIVGTGASGLSTAFTEAVYDQFKCMISCRISSDGSVNVEQFNNILSDVDDQTGTAWTLIELWMNLRGPVGFTRLGAAAGITTGDCDDCECPTREITMLFGTCPESIVEPAQTVTMTSVAYPNYGASNTAYLVSFCIPASADVTLAFSGYSIWDIGDPTNTVYSYANAPLDGCDFGDHTAVRQSDNPPFVPLNWPDLKGFFVASKTAFTVNVTFDF